MSAAASRVIHFRRQPLQWLKCWWNAVAISGDGGSSHSSTTSKEIHPDDRNFESPVSDAGQGLFMAIHPESDEVFRWHVVSVE